MNDMPPDGWFKYIKAIKGGRPIGKDGRIRVHYFLDLLSAVHNTAMLQELTAMLADAVRQRERLDEVAGIAGVKAGNAILAYQVGRKLAKSTLLTRSGILFEQWIEGFAAVGDKVIIVDDVASDGELLREAVVNLRRSGVFTSGVYVVVDREEGDTASALAEEKVPYSYLFQLNDKQLESIYRRGVQG
jgi:orotate phosphoribosyltransferase